jgi:hypothetical protein
MWNSIDVPMNIRCIDKIHLVKQLTSDYCVLLMILHNFNHEMTAFFFVEEHISHEEMVEEVEFIV